MPLPGFELGLPTPNSFRANSLDRLAAMTIYRDLQADCISRFVGWDVGELRPVYRDCQTQLEKKLGVFVLYLRLLLEIFIMLYGLQFDQSSWIESSQGLCQAEVKCI